MAICKPFVNAHVRMESEGSRIECRRLAFFGHVQGVGFRWTARELAARLGLRGSIRNASDGSVEAIVHGPSGLREAWIEGLRSRFEVSRVDDSSGPDDSVPEGFSIRR